MELHTQRYREGFDESLFRTVESEVLLHVFKCTSDDPIKREMYLSQDRPHAILEAIKSTARQIVKTPGYRAENGVNRLIITTVAEDLPMSTIGAITTFLGGFAAQECAIAQDYQNAMRIFHNLKEMEQGMLDAVRCASTLHGSQGQMIYECLTAAQYLLFTVQAVLQDDSRYGSEKFTAATTHVKWAQTSANAYCPDVFTDKPESV
ncbi:MAG: hypothetical protein AAFU54_19090 [Chloroflexota bacterium]